jgi:hypothetical protein
MKPGDKVMADGMVATVLCDVDAGAYSAEYPAADWASVLKSGVLVMTAEAGPIHYADASEVHPISN